MVVSGNREGGCFSRIKKVADISGQNYTSYSYLGALIDLGSIPSALAIFLLTTNFMS